VAENRVVSSESPFLQVIDLIEIGANIGVKNIIGQIEKIYDINRPTKTNVYANHIRTKTNGLIWSILVLEKALS